jgi:hypothetical protein
MNAQALGAFVLIGFAVAASALPAAGQLARQCPNSPAVRNPQAAAAASEAPATAQETPVWKTITIGNLKGVNATRAAIETAPCLIWIGDEADEILGRPAFPFVKKPVELDLVVLSVFELGFGDRVSRSDVELAATVQASLADIHARAVALGFELCPAEVGPALRLSYLDQPYGEFLHIAMQPVARSSGELVDFIVGNGGAGLLIVGATGHAGTLVTGAARFVFVRPRPDTLAGVHAPSRGGTLEAMR